MRVTVKRMTSSALKKALLFVFFDKNVYRQEKYLTYYSRCAKLMMSQQKHYDENYYNEIYY